MKRIATVISFGLVSTLTSSSLAQVLQDIRIEPTRISSHPFVKTKLGVARASGFEKLPEATQYLGELGARNLCTTVSFDDIVDRNRPQRAFQPGWFKTLQNATNDLNIDLYVGVVGAPKPYQKPNIRKPAAHPTPTDIPKSADSTAVWALQSLDRNIPVNWVIWNEPEHTLRGVNSSLAANDMDLIYRAYVNSLGRRFRYDGFGLAGFMKASLRGSQDIPSRTFFQLMLDRLGSPDSPIINSRTDYLTMNNFHGRNTELFAFFDGELRAGKLDLPLHFTQYAPEEVGQHPEISGSVAAASLYLDRLDRFVQTPGLGFACMSFWTGSERKALLRYIESENRFQKSPAFKAISFYQRLPLWRIETDVRDLNVLAAVDGRRLGVLISPVFAPPSSDGDAGTEKLQKSERKAARRKLRKDERLTNRAKGRDTEGEWETQAVSTALLSPQQPLRLLIPGMDGETFSAESFGSVPSVARKQFITVKNGILSLGYSKGDILYLSNSKQSQLRKGLLPKPLQPIRHDLYVHRTALGGQPLTGAQLGAASMDPKQDGFVLSVPQAVSTAHASATYRLPQRRLILHWSTPPGQAVKAARACSAGVVQYLRKRSVVASTSWGNPETIKRIQSSRAFNLSQRSSAQSAPSGSDHLAISPADSSDLLIVNPPPGADSFKLHLGLGGCQQPTQVRIIPYG